MQTQLFFLLISTTTLLGNPYANGLGRRILHQPFFTESASPPPSPSKPFSSESPFFPINTSPPSATTTTPTPSHPSPLAYASFPANISSLILPRSSSSSKSYSKLTLASIVSASAALALLSVVLFVVVRRRRRKRRSGDAQRSELYSSTDSKHPGEFTRNGVMGNGNRTGIRSGGSATGSGSDFLYLGTVVNSHAGVEGDRTDAGKLDPRKLGSPDLQPLPPLARHGANSSEVLGFCQDPSETSVYRGDRRAGGEVDGTTEEEEEEFYSPRVSLEGRDSSIGDGSSSRRGFLAMEGSETMTLGDESRRNRKSVSSSASSCSSSRSGSPSRSQSHSITLSPPGSVSPRRSLPKSPDSIPSLSRDESRTPLVLSDSNSSSPERDLRTGRMASASPSLSPMAWSPSTNQERKKQNDHIPDVSLRIWTVNEDHTDGSSVSSSPRISSVSNGITTRSRLSASLSASPARALGDNRGESPRLSDASAQSEKFSLPSPDSSSPRPLNASLASPERMVYPLQSVTGGAPPPPLPPPPLPPLLPPQPRPLQAPTPSTPTDQLILQPPKLVLPAKPFLMQSTVEVSPMELPQTLETFEKVDGTPKLKLKPLHWDKVRASSDREMVWDHLRSSSFKLNEEMIETLFVVNTPATRRMNDATPRSVLPSPQSENRVLDPKKSQNIAILLKALNVTIEEVCEALLEGNAETLGTDLLESLLKMAPTKEEERKLKDYTDDSPVKLGPAEKFLKSLLDVPLAFNRVDAMLYMSTFESEVEYLRRSFETLEGACEELRNSRMFLKLLEAVLKTGNRMNVGTNRGDAEAFKLDTLLKLVDVKGADGKTTLLHFVVQEIIRTEGARCSGTNQSNSVANDEAKCRRVGLQVVSGLTTELVSVKKAATMDSNVLSSDVNKLSKGIENMRDLARLVDKVGLDENTRKFSENTNRFARAAEEEIIRIQAQESVAMSLVKEITEYFHGDSAKEEAHPFRIFMVVRDFLAVLDRVCKEAGSVNDRTMVTSAHRMPIPVNPMLPVPINMTLPQAFPSFHRRQRDHSMDDESTSP